MLIVIRRDAIDDHAHDVCYSHPADSWSRLVVRRLDGGKFYFQQVLHGSATLQSNLQFSHCLGMRQGVVQQTEQLAEANKPKVL
jgi:hypothetical protein